jgi:hypothetical protein
MRKPAFRNWRYPWTEEHHLTPRAWQAAWRPSPQTAPLRNVLLSHDLWAPETYPVENSAHSWVHVWIDWRLITEHQYAEPSAALRELIKIAPGKRTQIYQTADLTFQRAAVFGIPLVNMPLTR